MIISGPFSTPAPENDQDQATLYLNIMDFGWSGKKSLVNTKYKTAEKPEWKSEVIVDNVNDNSSEESFHFYINDN